MRQADLVVATGSQANVRAAYASGTPAFGVGAGNVAAIVDETADLDRGGREDRALEDLRQRDQLLVGEQRRAGRGRRTPLRVGACKRSGAVLLDAGRRRRGCSELMWPDGKLSARGHRPVGRDDRRARRPRTVLAAASRAS